METTITLADGSPADLTALPHDDLWRLQFEQEKAFAEQILETEKGSPQRAETIGRGYDTVCRILSELNADGPLVMGLDRRYVELVLALLKERQFTRTGPARLFEIGYGSGALLAQVATAGFDVAGIEVSQAVRQQALSVVPNEYHDRLYFGDFASHPLDGARSEFDVVYWNDVFEHIPPDEIQDFLTRTFELLRPGGCLLTITPNWHERPSDVTGDFCPPRTTAAGLHLREYTLREVTALLRETGYAEVETPLCVSPSQIKRGWRGLAGVKRLCEPLLEFLPFKAAEALCHGFGLSLTIAHKRKTR
jgi:SAM-dependent methyltransferase